jgi:two-component system, NtrC family, sensor histidine kinase HydH
MQRWTALALTLVIVLMASVTAIAVYLVAQNRRALLEQFQAGRAKQVNEAARILDEDFDHIATDLAFVGELVQSTTRPEERQRNLAALLAVGKNYRRIDVFDGSGNRILSVDSDSNAGAEDLAQAMMQTALESLKHAPGNIETTPPLEAEGRRSARVFATAFPSPTDPRPAGAVALLVDTAALFDKLRLVTSGQASRLLLLGTHGRATAASDPQLILALARLDAAPVEGALRTLLEQMRSGKTGTLLLPSEETRRHGLDGGEAVAAFASIPLKGGEHWALATISPLMPVRRHERALLFRLIAATAAFSVCLAILGAYVVAASRRAVAMAERIRHADQVAYLHEKTDKILDNIPVGVIALSAEGRLTSINRALREKLGDGALGADLGRALPEAPPALVARLSTLCELALCSGRVQSVLGERMSLFGEERQYTVHAVPLESKFPEARSLLVIEDLSDIQSLEAQLVRAEKLATVGTLAAGIAHEIGTPLGVVRGRAEYLRGKLGEAHPHQNNLSTIIQEIDRVTRTIRQLLDFSRVTPASIRPVRAVAAAQAVSELLRFEAERRKVSIVVNASDLLPPLAADPDQFQQVLVNLVMNACDACGSGGRVLISARSADQNDSSGWRRIRIEVSDNGRGIPEEDRARVFDPFFTTKKRGEGTGLGLTVAAQIVRNHGAEIELESEPGQGTRVALLWPAVSSARERMNESAA